MQTEKTFLFAESCSNCPGGIKLFLVPDRWEFLPDSDAIKLGEVTPTFPVPEGLTADELRRRAIQTLQDKQRKARADAERRVQELQEQIDKLLLLSYDGGDNVSVLHPTPDDNLSF